MHLRLQGGNRCFRQDISKTEPTQFSSDYQNIERKWSDDQSDTAEPTL